MPRQAGSCSSCQTLGAVFKPFAIQQFIREFLEALVQEARSAFGYSRPLEVLEESPHRFVASAGRGKLSVDKAANTITLGGRLIAPVRAVTSIEIARSRNEDGPGIWKVSICVLRNRRIEIGRLLDDTEASILGA